MRVGLYWHPDSEGGGRYFRALVGALPTVAPQHEYVVYLDRPPRDGPPPRHRRVRYCLLPGRPGEKAFWPRLQIALPQRLRRDHIDVFHAHFYRVPVDAPCRIVVTIHDPFPLLSPRGTVCPTWQPLYAHQFRMAIRLADHVIASSRYTQQQLVRKLGVAPEKVTRIYPGCPRIQAAGSQAASLQAVRQRLGLQRPFILSVGTLLPRKNYPLLIHAFRKRLRKTHDLVIVGQLAWWWTRVLRLIGRDPTIRYLGPVSDQLLEALYAAAACLVYPSREEGFGFPPLEAMASGTPVVALRVTSVPEVVGDAGVLVEPGSVSRLATAIERLLDDTVRQEDLRRRGRRRARQFSWAATAAETARVYERVVDGVGGGRWERA